MLQASRRGARVRAGDYTLRARAEGSYDEVLERVRSELAAEGFGVLCEIDVRATLEAKLGVEREPYVILGACNPPLAHLALESEPELGVLLPCNVVVYQSGGATHVTAIDPETMLSVVDNELLAPIAAEVKRRLCEVVERSALAAATNARESG